MSLTLRTAISVSQTTIDIAGTDALVVGSLRTIGSETIEIRTADQPVVGYLEAPFWRATVERGVLGSVPAAHDSGTSVGSYSPGGGGAISVTDGTTTVAAASSLTVPAGTLSDGGAGAGVVASPTLGQAATSGAIVDVPIIFSDGGVIDGGNGIYIEADVDESGLAGALSLQKETGGGGARIVGGFADGVGGGATVSADGRTNGSTGSARIVGGAAAGGSDAVGGDIALTPGPGDGAGRHGLVFANLPTTDPHVAGALWANSGIVTVSAG